MDYEISLSPSGQYMVYRSIEVSNSPAKVLERMQAIVASAETHGTRRILMDYTGQVVDGDSNLVGSFIELKDYVQKLRGWQMAWLVQAPAAAHASYSVDAVADLFGALGTKSRFFHSRAQALAWLTTDD